MGDDMNHRLYILPFLFFLASLASSAQGIVERADCVSEIADFISRCGYVLLPQDYQDPRGGRVQIYYSVVHSQSATPQPDPLVYLVGGPGSSGSYLLPTSFEAYLSAFAVDRDIVVIDQRGTGRSHPSLYCLEALRRLDEILESRHAEHAELMLDILTECQRRLAGSGVKFDAFHSENNARDIVNVLRALGYERWNLVGVSYGSRLALVIMRDFPQYVRSAILDSVYPPQADIYLDVYYSGERALSALFEACAASEGCSARYPDLEAVFYRLYHRLNRTPLTVAYRPPSFDELEIEISGYRLYEWVFNWLYDLDSIRQIPKMIYELHQDRPDYVAHYGIAYEMALTTLSLGMHYSVQCQEEYGSGLFRDYAGMLARHPHLSGFLRYPVDGTATLPQLCDLWRTRARPDHVNDPVASDIPALLLSGGYDPITPPAYARAAQATLTSAYNFTFPQVGHAVLRSEDCAVRIAVDFINEPLREPDSSCIAETQAIEFD